MSDRDQQRAGVEAELAQARARVEELQGRLAALDGVPEPTQPMPISINGIRYCPVCWETRGEQQALADHPDNYSLARLSCGRCGYAIDIVE